MQERDFVTANVLNGLNCLNDLNFERGLGEQVRAHDIAQDWELQWFV